MNSIELNIRLKSPLSHGAFSDGGSTGNAMQFRREPLVGVSGNPRVPVISGNAIRGVMRRLIMRELFEKAQVTRDNIGELMPEFKGSMRAWDRLYAALAQGGTIEEAEKQVKPDQIRELRHILPPLSLFGSALYSCLVSGMLNVGFALSRLSRDHTGRNREGSQRKSAQRRGVDHRCWSSTPRQP